MRRALPGVDVHVGDGGSRPARSCAELPRLVAEALEDGSLARRCEALAGEVRASVARRAVTGLVNAAADAPGP